MGTLKHQLNSNCTRYLCNYLIWFIEDVADNDVADNDGAKRGDRTKHIRASALGIVNAKCKENLAFQALKCSASGIAKSKYCKFNLQYCYSAILKVEFSLEFLSPLLLFLLCSLSFFSLSHLLSPLFKPKHHPPPNINITHHSGGNVDLHFFFFLLRCYDSRR